MESKYGMKVRLAYSFWIHSRRIRLPISRAVPQPRARQSLAPIRHGAVNGNPHVSGRAHHAAVDLALHDAHCGMSGGHRKPRSAS